MKYLKIILMLTFTILGMASVSAVHYNIDLEYSPNDNSFSLETINLVGTGPDNKIQHPGFTTNLIAFNSSIIYKLNFSVTTYHVPIEKTSITLSFPYFNYAKELHIYNSQGRLVFTIDLASYATCNQNLFCEINENNETCPEDCVKENIIKNLKTKSIETVDESIINKTEKFPEGIRDKKSYNLLIFITIMILILGILGYLFFKLKCKRQKP